MSVLECENKEPGTDTLVGDTNRAVKIQDWLSDPEKYVQDIENTGILIDRLLNERKALLAYIKALRFWAYEVIGGSVNLNDLPTDMILLEAMMNLPEYLRKEIQKD